jgi:hypothetical protein
MMAIAVLHHLNRYTPYRAFGLSSFSVSVVDSSDYGGLIDRVMEVDYFKEWIPSMSLLLLSTKARGVFLT